MRTCRTAMGAMLLLAVAGLALAQAPDLEPGVQTSPVTAPAPAPRLTPPKASPPPSNPARAATPAATTPAAAPPADDASRAASGVASGVTKGNGKSDRIELDTTQISGNRELPKVMYVVPWRHADPGEFAGRPPNSLLDEALTPVDRDVFRRQNRYYSALESGSGAAGAPASQSAAGAAAPRAPESKDEK